MEKISIRKDVLLIGICETLYDHIKRRYQPVPSYDPVVGMLQMQYDSGAEDELAKQLETVRLCHRNRFEILVPTYEVEGTTDE